jgi:SpoVK/Ycf46/Vps4 family AAA+-type ATPase
MARGELMKKLITSYGRDDTFRAVAEQIIGEEERKGNRVLASSLRKSLDRLGEDALPRAPASKLLPFPDEARDFIQRVEPRRTSAELLLSRENTELFAGIIREFRQADRLRRHGLDVRSKLLFCGPPGTGKTMCAEVFAGEMGLPFFHVRLDSLVSSYLGETATNIRKTFEFARRQPCVLFFDEFDALARSREEASETGELRRVVNSLLMFIEQIEPGGFLIAATNLAGQLDPAIWRRFDEVVWFDLPDAEKIDAYLRHAFRNVSTSINTAAYVDRLSGSSYAELARITQQAIKLSILNGNTGVSDEHLRSALRNAERRRVRVYEGGTRAASL